MQEVKVRIEFLIKDIEAVKKLVFEKTEEELKNNQRNEKYYAFCCIEAALISAKNYSQVFLDKYGETTEANNDKIG